MNHIVRYTLFESVSQEEVDDVLDKMGSGITLTKFDKFKLDTYSRYNTLNEKDRIISNIKYNVLKYDGVDLCMEELELENSILYDDYQLIEYFGVDSVHIQVYTEDWEYTEESFGVKYEDLDISILNSIKQAIDRAIMNGFIEADDV